MTLELGMRSFSPTRAASRICIGLLAAWLIVSLPACGGRPGNIASVSGTVTLDGQPLANARISFAPKNGQQGSTGTTDDSGRYTLFYSRDHEGAEIGEHSVSISTFVPANPDSDPPIERVPERVPTNYNQDSTLVAKVESGSNTLDFKIESQGAIIQPDQIKDQD